MSVGPRSRSTQVIALTWSSASTSPACRNKCIGSWQALGVDVDTTPYALSFEDTVDYLAAQDPGL